ncbi:unnamed protein product [Malassezia sympodialis ATCC 42132]|uniref:uncharacterized protein n=1 Tax=Malassezia sympodialis (strain ATCC 42132) TaxID=1230383 RepID=UPI0002C2C999|nr:uncharacterized protein MSY001_0558 [Malassezia sympodialis ATCC 42132]CCU97852.1 unnamed protein product [Malassezia sympodialis ATCC 42132]|eukprot:XP_018739184.1 uncharacterized protein MSY001_0558 [Malassezia sympodialis ATCC 42132]
MSSSRAASAAIRRLTIEYKQLTSDPNTLFPAVGPISEDNYLEWEALLPGPDDTPFEGGVFSARLSFRTCHVLTTQRRHTRWNPRKCASTRRSSTRTYVRRADAVYESSSERWSPVQSIEKILLSVLSMLAEPNVESGANIDACKLYRDDRAAYEQTIRDQVQAQLGL